MVYSGKYNVLASSARYLALENGGLSGVGIKHDKCRLVYITLNNLSAPIEKRVMAIGPLSKDIIEELCKIIAQDSHEPYLCCICLMNLSCLESANRIIL